MQTGNGRSNRFGFGKLAIIVAQLFALTTVAYKQAYASANDSHRIHVAAISNTPASDALDGITLTGTYTDADYTYLRQTLEMLRDQMPLWSQYIGEAKPLTLVVDLNEGAHGRAAVAKCCAGNRGVITFGHHFGTLTDSDDTADQTPDARRIRFLVTLVHETTHVRDQRAGKFLSKTNFKSCMDTEKSAFEEQIAFENDLLNVVDGDAQAWLAQQVKSEIASLRTRELWQQYCGAFES